MTDSRGGPPMTDPREGRNGDRSARGTVGIARRIAQRAQRATPSGHRLASRPGQRSTGLRTSKFGVPISEAVEAYAEAKALPNVDVIGLDCHIGSQLVSIEPFADALARVASLVVELRGGELEIEWTDNEAHVFMTGPAAEVFTGEFPVTDPRDH